MDGVRGVLEDTPDPVSEVKVKRMEVMNFGDGVYMMAFQCHGEERRFEDVAKYAGVRNGIERYYEVKGGARIQDCIGIVEYLNAKGNEFEW